MFPVVPRRTYRAVLRDQVRDKVPIKIETRGEQTVKNIARPIEVFCIIGEDRDGVASRPPNPGPQLFCLADGSNAPISTLSEKFTALNIPAGGISISLSKTLD